MPIGLIQCPCRCPLLLRLHKGECSLLLQLADVWAGFNRLQQCNPIAKPLIWIMALKWMGLDHRLPVAPFECLAAHDWVLPTLLQ